MPGFSDSGALQKSIGKRVPGLDYKDLRSSLMSYILSVLQSCIFASTTAPKCLSMIKKRKSILPQRFHVNVCTLCFVKIYYSKDNEKIFVVYADRTTILYAESRCHPCFVPKYSGVAKFFGWVGHVLT